MMLAATGISALLLLSLLGVFGNEAPAGEESEQMRTVSGSVICVDTDVQGDEVQPARAPILLRIVLTNRGKAPIFYWTGGPGDYPDAADFTARVINARGKPFEAALSNGQARFGSGVNQTIDPGKSVVFPAAIEALSPGTYTITICEALQGLDASIVNAKSATVTVKEDSQLLQKREKDILARIAAGEPFAKHVVRMRGKPNENRGKESADGVQYLVKSEKRRVLQQSAIYEGLYHLREGWLDADGQFVRNLEKASIVFPLGQSDVLKWGEDNEKKHNLCIHNLKRTGLRPDWVYEYQKGGTLVLGELDQGMFFLRDPESVPLDKYLKTYQHGTTPRIHNLPGRVMTKQEFDAEAKKEAEAMKQK